MTTPEGTPINVTPIPTTDEDRTVAIVSYLTLIGFIVAVVLHGNRKTTLGAYHLRQSLGLHVAMIALWVALAVLAFLPVIGWLILMLSWILWVGLFVLWLMGLVAAASGQIKPVPVLGEPAQKWFAGAFA